MSACIVVEMEGFSDWPETFGGYVVIPAQKRPTALQTSREAAEQEVMRLVALHPGCRFVIFEAVALGMKISVPTHVNLEGNTLVSGMVPAVMSLPDVDAAIPF